MDLQNNIPPLNLPAIEGIENMPNNSSTEPNKVNIANQPITSAAPNLASGQQNNATDSPNPVGSSSQTISTPAIADDVDLIEKEWVKKISQIVLKTKGNPYERARQLTILKQDYLQKRYSKTIKIA
jgi:Txe/YoeB family toxin of Txe-Axe toxin-antitoxin module